MSIHFETILMKVSFTIAVTETIVEVEYIIVEDNTPHKAHYTRSKSFPVERDVVSIINNELHTLDFLRWRGVRKGKK